MNEDLLLSNSMIGKTAQRAFSEPSAYVLSYVSKSFKEFLEIFDVGFFALRFLPPPPKHDTAGSIVNVCPGWFDTAVMESARNKSPCFTFFELFFCNDLNESFFTLLSNIAVPFVHHIIDIVYSSDEVIDKIFLASQVINILPYRTQGVPSSVT